MSLGTDNEIGGFYGKKLVPKVSDMGKYGGVAITVAENVHKTQEFKMKIHAAVGDNSNSTWD